MQEISQFTYFQQAGGVSLPVPAVEITYGLERILMAVQRVQHFKDIRFNQQVTYGRSRLLTMAVAVENECVSSLLGLLPLPCT